MALQTDWIQSKLVISGPDFSVFPRGPTETLDFCILVPLDFIPEMKSETASRPTNILSFQVQ